MPQFRPGGSRLRCPLFSFIIFVAAATACALPAWAHETWILPAFARVESPRIIALAITSGMVFPHSVTAIPAERLNQSGIRIGKQNAGQLQPRGEMGSNLLASADLNRPGIACVWLALPELPVDLTPELVQVYFDEIQADPEVRRAWAARKSDLWQERYEKFAKAIVRVGEVDPSDRSWAAPIGGALEIVPESDPTTMTPGAAFTVRVLKSGRPLAGLMLAAQEKGKRDWQRTDLRGRATFQLTGNGPWLIHGTQLRPADSSGTQWRSWFTTLTIARQGVPGR